MANKLYDINMGAGFGLGIPGPWAKLVKRIPVVGNKLALGVSVTEYVIEDVMSHERALYAYKTFDGGAGLLPFTVNLQSSKTRFDSKVDVHQFGGQVELGGAATGKDSYFAYMKWIDGPAKGLRLSTSGWQLSTPGAGMQRGRLELMDVFVPSAVPWDRALLSIDVWSMTLPVQGNLIDNNAVAHFGKLKLDATRSTMPLGYGSTYSWQWEPDQKCAQLPTGLRNLGRQSGVWDPFHDAQDSINLALRYDKNGEDAFLRLAGGAELIDGTVPVVQNSAAGIRSRVGQPLQTGGLPVPMPVTNGAIHYNGKWYQIIWILTHREVATNG